MTEYKEAVSGSKLKRNFYFLTKMYIGIFWRSKG